MATVQPPQNIAAASLPQPEVVAEKPTATLDGLEKKQLEELEEKMRMLELGFKKEIEERKRKAEEEMELE